jgi:uncharacterized heparinase superfamily protein
MPTISAGCAAAETGAMSFAIAGRPLGQCMGQLWYRLRLPLFASPLYRAMLSGAPAFQLTVAPPDPWPGDADRGAAILAGSFPLAHSVLAAEGEAIWDLAGAPRPWLDELHSFQWLADLRTLGGGAARRQARELMAGWCRRFGFFNAQAWRPSVLARRLSAWLGHYDFVAGSADDETRARFFRALLRQLRHLDRIGNAVGDPIDRLVVAKVMIAGGIALPDDGDRVTPGLKRLQRALAQDFLADGGHATRSPAVQVEALRHLVDIRAALGAAGRSIPDALQTAIDRLAGVVRFLRHGDGGMALFHDGNEEEGWRIDVVLAQAVARAGMPARLPQTGYERLQAGRTVVIMDAGAPPPAGMGARGHASALAFEMSVGKERMIVSMGAAPTAEAEWRHLQRASAAHSTLVVADTNSVPIRRSGGFGRWRGTVAARREDRDGAVLAEARHNFYAARFGLAHRRRLYLAAGGEDLRGEDTLEGPAGRAYAIRFHLHPEVRASLLQGGGALLRLPAGSGWRMRVDGAAIALGDSVYFGHGGDMKRTQQIVLSGTTGEGGETVVRWAFQREGRKP